MLKKVKKKFLRNIQNIIFKKLIMLEANKILNNFIGNKTIASNVIKSFNNSNYSGVWF